MNASDQTVKPALLTGYADPLAARAGGSVDFMLASDLSGDADVALVRLLHGDTNPLGPGFVEREVATVSLPGRVAVGPRDSQRGAFARVEATPHLSEVSAGTLHAFICATRPGGTEQAIAGCWDDRTRTGYLLLIDAQGHLCLRLGDGAVHDLRLGRRIEPHIWYFVAAGWDLSAGRRSLSQQARINRWNSRVGPVVPYDLDDMTSSDAAFGFKAAAADFLIAGAHDADGKIGRLYNGKIDRLGLQNGLLDRAGLAVISEGRPASPDRTIAYWDTSRGYSDRGIGDRIEDVGPGGLHAIGVNRPIRAMTGWNWDGRNDSFHLAPEQFGAIVFHDDALIDCNWPSSLRLDLPSDLPSGVYALRVRMGGREDHVPFFVRPARPTAATAVLMPTFTYLAYANEHLSFEAPIAQAICSNVPIVTEEEIHWKAQEEYGLSTYDVHSDGGGVCYSSWRRPILNMRPRYRMPATNVPWAFPADLSLIWWLDHMGHDCDILTDHDLDRDGAAALTPYKAVITGTHPEYHSERMLDGIEDYLSGGGHMLYLGGNGFYWVTAVRPDEPWCIEVRKLDSGSRAWQAAPGEGHLATTGERSGLWRSRGRAPQKLVGLGFTTEGMDESKPFERLPDSHDPANAWIFDGVGEQELIGDFGLGLGGASGIEMDRYDLMLGTPPHTALLASSFGHSDNYLLVSEDIGYAFPGRGGTQDPQVRGDIAYFTTAGGGAVFAAGSIAWSQALPCNGGDNNVSRITDNVLRRFVGGSSL